MVKCRVCGASVGKKIGLCNLGNICCECANVGFGCFRKPLVRHEMQCRIEIHSGDIAKGDEFHVRYFNIRDVAKFRKEWTVLATETPYALQSSSLEAK